MVDQSSKKDLIRELLTNTHSFVCVPKIKIKTEPEPEPETETEAEKFK